MSFLLLFRRFINADIKGKMTTDRNFSSIGLAIAEIRVFLGRLSDGLGGRWSGILTSVRRDSRLVRLVCACRVLVETLRRAWLSGRRLKWAKNSYLGVSAKFQCQNIRSYKRDRFNRCLLTISGAYIFLASAAADSLWEAPLIAKHSIPLCIGEWAYQPPASSSFAGCRNGEWSVRLQG